MTALHLALAQAMEAGAKVGEIPLEFSTTEQFEAAMAVFGASEDAPLEMSGLVLRPYTRRRFFVEVDGVEFQFLGPRDYGVQLPLLSDDGDDEITEERGHGR